MNLNKEFLSEVISYLINRGVTLTDVLDTFNEHFNTLDAFTNDVKKHGIVTESPYKLVVTPLTPLSHKNTEENPEPLNVSLSPNTRDYPTSPIPRGKGVSKARKMLFEVVEGKTVLEHLKANNIDYKLFDTRIRKNWSMEKACTTPLTRVVQPYTKSKKPVEKAAPVIVSDNVKVVEETPIEKPEETLETQNDAENTVLATILAANQDANIVCLESEKITGTKTVIPAENTAENVTIEPQTETDTDTRVEDTNADSDVKNSESERIEQLADKTVRDIVTGKNKEKKKAEPKKDYATSDLCFKLNVTTHELREMVNCGDFPQPDRGNKWSAKLLKEKGVI